MNFALIKNGIVENVIVADQAFVDTIAQEWDRIVETTTAGVGWLDDGTNLTAPPQPDPPPAPADPCEWLIDLGPFYDRFGAAKMAVLTSADAGVKAIMSDVAIRKWIDLQRADVASSLAYIGGVVPALTGALQTAILITPVTADENRALRKLYF